MSETSTAVSRGSQPSSLYGTDFVCDGVEVVFRIGPEGLLTTYRADFYLRDKLVKRISLFKASKGLVWELKMI